MRAGHTLLELARERALRMEDAAGYQRVAVKAAVTNFATESASPEDVQQAMKSRPFPFLISSLHFGSLSGRMRSSRSQSAPPNVPCSSPTALQACRSRRSSSKTIQCASSGTSALQTTRKCAGSSASSVPCFLLLGLSGRRSRVPIHENDKAVWGHLRSPLDCHASSQNPLTSFHAFSRRLSFQPPALR